MFKCSQGLLCSRWRHDGVNVADTFLFANDCNLIFTLLLKKLRFHVTGSNVSTGEAAVTSMKINLNAVVSKVLRETTVKKVKAFDKTQQILDNTTRKTY